MTTTFKVDSIGSDYTANATAFEQKMLAVAGYAMTDNGQSAQLLRLRAVLDFIQRRRFLRSRAIRAIPT